MVPTEGRVAKPERLVGLPPRYPRELFRLSPVVICWFREERVNATWQAVLLETLLQSVTLSGFTKWPKLHDTTLRLNGIEQRCF